ncbi:MAG: 50S ribosomal protein L17 [Microgenomates group bacterium GW2011_GWC1_38_14]|nr:MAG: 50S ribosomal protein L17 [Candidatus Levybacteria bacterium GW2011_GWA2_36_13]KKQ00816.1 MAG: 50S ribosomal protein L17 [Candidatus Levybacteria bacterium GW2011_GWB1_36_18]KKQ58321.1 MAG: 50S ribosomal protein L17 [Microgenomates group bacterium GW2011_GWC1_38_14]KKR15914.1 MAG: 50S ribosomal protein L17 [Candidatus Levybacteria bacterium GW2011_GWA1_39_32]OGH43856.1 MAG: 50S ribosomal protein L17 [Candidatus Levybacteria bacterium RIFCSPLOWO2_02_FULL_37_11]
MRKNVFGRQLKRDKNERKALFKSLISSFILRGNIKTTQAKAKSVKGEIDKLVTKAKKNKLPNSGEYLTQDALNKLKSIAPNFSRNSGFTRIIKLGNRFSDNASYVLMEWVEEIKEIKSEGKIAKTSKKKEVKVEKTKTRAKTKKAPVKKTPTERRATK